MIRTLHVHLLLNCFYLIISPNCGGKTLFQVPPAAYSYSYFYWYPRRYSLQALIREPAASSSLHSETQLDLSAFGRGKISSRTSMKAGAEDNSDDSSIEVVCVKDALENKGKADESFKNISSVTKSYSRESINKSRQNQNGKKGIHQNSESQIGGKMSKKAQNQNVVSINKNQSSMQRPESQSQPMMIILIGIPGSGKSTFANKLVSMDPNKFVRISQDQLKKRKKCETRCRQALTQSKTVIIDRANFDATQRKYFTDIALEFNNNYDSADGNDSCGQNHIVVDCIYFNFEKNLCIRRCEERTNHETLPNNDSRLIRQVVSRMYNSLRIPQNDNSSNDDGEKEIYRKIVEVKSFKQANKLVQQYASDLK